MIRPASHVRCLGWDNLEHEFSRLSTAVSWTLERLGVDYTVNERISRGGLGWHFSATPPQQSPKLAVLSPEELDDPDPVDAVPGLSLRVCVWIFAATPAASSSSAQKFHVNLRRMQGDQWQFHYFYAAFRREFSANLGMGYHELSQYSPVQSKRVVADGQAPAVVFLSRGTLSQPPSLAACPVATGDAAHTAPTQSQTEQRVTASTFLAGVRRTAKVPKNILAGPQHSKQRES